ncbi:MAG: hypothetical protein Phog2KO_40200 [Phototrophicaceae bacterium]
MAINSPIFDELLDYLVEKATPQEVLSFKPSDNAQARATELLDKNNEGTILPVEVHELEQLRQYNAMLMKLKLKAQVAIQQS